MGMRRHGSLAVPVSFTVVAVGAIVAGASVIGSSPTVDRGQGITEQHSVKSSLSAGSSRVGRSMSATQVVVIDPSIPETFAPSSHDTAALSSDAAFQVYARLNDSNAGSPPKGVNVQLGRLTLPVGSGEPDAYIANDQVVWAFSWPSCPPTTLPKATATSGPCVEWLFLDANSGAEVDQTWQQ